MSAFPSPLDLVELPFLRTALFELGLLAATGGLIGTWIVLRRLAFFAHATGSVTFPGLVAADASGVSPLIAGLAVALGYAGGVERARSSGRAPGDTAVALLLVAALATGIVLASDVFHSSASVDRLLFGTLLGLSAGDVALSAAALVLALAGTLLLGRVWTAAAFDPAGAPALRIPAVAPDLLLLALTATAAVATIPAVGALLVSAFLVVPAATARLLAKSVPAMLAWGVAIAALEGLAGLYLAYWLDAPPGPAIAVLGSATFLAASLTTAAR
ncbi:MAG: metal ABC transporter permease [Thermoleophilaceae bacterium]